MVDVGTFSLDTYAGGPFMRNYAEIWLKISVFHSSVASFPQRAVEHSATDTHHRIPGKVFIYRAARSSQLKQRQALDSGLTS